MLQIKEKLCGFAKKLWMQMKSLTGKTLRFAGRHRIPTTALCGVLTLSMLMSVITVSIHEVTVLENGTEIDRFHAILTDEQSLMEKAEITLSPADEMTVNETEGKVTLSIVRAFPVSIKADGQTVTVLLTRGTVADALKKADITCNEADILSHELTAALTPEMEITLDRVTSDELVIKESIDFTTKKVETNDLYKGETKVQQEGEKGERTLTYKLTYLNGEESNRELISDEVTKEPIEKIVLVGTKIKSSFKTTASTPKKYKQVIAMEATAYSEGGYTASGIPARVGVVAVDPKVIPLGTKVYVETADGQYIYGTAIAADTGGAIKGNKIDLCVHTRAEAYRFGRRVVNVYIL